MRVSSEDKYQPIQVLGEETKVRRTCTTLSLIATLGLAALLLVALAMPAGASAGSSQSRSKSAAAKACKALRAELGPKAFKRAFHAKKLRGAYRRCVKRKGAVRALAPVDSFPAPETSPCQPVEQPQPVSAFSSDPCAQPAPVCDDDADDDEQGDDDGDKKGDADDAETVTASGDTACTNSDDDQSEAQDDDDRDSDDD
jgi:hypothetical protein